MERGKWRGRGHPRGGGLLQDSAWAFSHRALAPIGEKFAGGGALL